MTDHSGGAEARRRTEERPAVSAAEGVPPTLREVGARAGVSAMTASRALRDDPSVSGRTRERVLAAAVELGYRRNELARNLRLGRTSGMIGLVVTNLANPFYSQLALGVETTAAERGMKVVLSNTADNVDHEREIVDDLAARRVDGIIVVPAGDDQSHLAPVQRHDIPLVLAARPPRDIDISCVLLDDFGGSKDAAERLYADGHRRIGFLGPPAAWNSAERLRGFRSVMETAGLAADERLVRCAQRDVTTAERAAQEMLALPDPPTALFCANNANTIGACRAVKHGRRETMVSGFDDFELADMLDVHLRLVTYDPEAMGRQAAALLLEHLDQAQSGARETAPARRVVLPTSIVDYTPEFRHVD